MFLKKVPPILFLLLILTSLISHNTYGQEALINTDYLNVRKGPGTQYEIFTQVHSEEIYPIIEQLDNWVKIELPEGTGWITIDYTTIIDQTDQDSSNTNHLATIKVSNDNTHIRNGPSVKDEIIDYVNKGTILTVISEMDEWYEVTYNNLTGYVYKPFIDNVFSFTNKFNDKTIVIDAGHGGRDIGAIGVEGSYEKNIAYLTTNKLYKTLSMLGAEVLLTRENDDYIPLNSRPVLANTHNTDAFLSIHYNSFPEQPSVTGIGTYYYDDYNKPLARLIQKNLIKTSHEKDRDISFDNFLVLRQNYKPSVLIELGFISNREKEQLLLTNEHQNRLVNGIIMGLSSYFTNH